MREERADRERFGKNGAEAHVTLAARAGERPGPVERCAPARGCGERRIWPRRGLGHGLSGAGGDAGAQRGVWGEQPGIVMPMAARRRDQRGESVDSAVQAAAASDRDPKYTASGV